MLCKLCVLVVREAEMDCLLVGDVLTEVVVACMRCDLRVAEENLQCRHKKLCDDSILLQCLELTLSETLRLGMQMCVEK